MCVSYDSFQIDYRTSFSSAMFSVSMKIKRVYKYSMIVFPNTAPN